MISKENKKEFENEMRAKALKKRGFNLEAIGLMMDDEPRIIEKMLRRKRREDKNAEKHGGL